MNVSAEKLMKGPVGIIANATKPIAVDAIRKVTAALRRRRVPWRLEAATAACCRTPGVELGRLLGHVTWLIVIGGDGTILQTARDLGRRSLPILGVNPGQSLGFMTDTLVDDLPRTLGDIAENQFSIVERATLQSRYHADTIHSPELLPAALNDVVFTHAGQARLIALDVRLNGVYFTTYSADGLVIATSTGSTAHSLSAGGPILFPSTEAMVLTPICPHTLSYRPVILPRGYTVDVRMGQPTRDVHMSIDGQSALPLGDTGWVSIQLGPTKVKFIHSSRQTFMDVLREKLHWRGDLRPEHATD